MAEETWKLSVKYLKPEESAVSAAAAADVWVCVFCWVSSWWKISKDIIIVDEDSGWNQLIVVVCNVNKNMWNVDGKDFLSWNL